MLNAFTVCKPSKEGATYIKPQARRSRTHSLSFERIFGRLWCVLISCRALKSTLHQLSRFYVWLFTGSIRWFRDVLNQ